MDRLLIFGLSVLLVLTPAVAQEPPFPGEPREGHEMMKQRRKRFNPMEEQELRERLQTLIRLPKEEITAELQKWPKYQKMNFEEQGRLLTRIQEMKEQQRSNARQKAEELGLKLTGKAMDQFELRLAEKRIEMGRQLREKVEPIRLQMEQQIDQDLKSEFGGSAPR